MNNSPKLTLRQATLLLYIDSGEEQLDPIRIMKGMFVFTMEAPAQWLPREQRYEFVPYTYGPYSAQVNADLNTLSLLGYVNSHSVPGRSWLYYSSSEKGKRAAESLASTYNKEALDYLQRLRQFIVGLSFRSLLNVVYQKYPEYAVNSVFK